MEKTIEQLKNENGGHWGEHKRYSLQDWRYEVMNDDTRLGYWEWVKSHAEED